MTCRRKKGTFPLLKKWDFLLQNRPNSCTSVCGPCKCSVYGQNPANKQINPSSGQPLVSPASYTNLPSGKHYFSLFLKTASLFCVSFFQRLKSPFCACSERETHFALCCIAFRPFVVIARRHGVFSVVSALLAAFPLLFSIALFHCLFSIACFPLLLFHCSFPLLVFHCFFSIAYFPLLFSIAIFHCLFSIACFPLLLFQCMFSIAHLCSCVVVVFRQRFLGELLSTKQIYPLSPSCDAYPAR